MSRQMVKAIRMKKRRAGRQADYEDRKPYKISDREENRRHSGRKISLYLSSKAGRPYNLWLQEDQKENKNVIVWH